MNRTDDGLPLTLERVGKSYAQRRILHALDLHIPAGQFVAVVGRSGCGKSTLLRLLAGLEQPDAGHVRVQNHALTSHSHDTRLMFQDARLLPWKNVLDNVGLGLSGKWQDAAHDALHAVGLHDRAQQWPATLSGGQKQRLALARALIHRPRLLLLDEPLGALDALTRIDMQALITELWTRHAFTAVLVTHDVQEAVALADRVLLVDDGRISLDLPVTSARPRRRDDAALTALEQSILSRILEPGLSPPRPMTTPTASDHRTALTLPQVS